MHLETITDKNLAEYIFTQGRFTGDKNSKNYTLSDFNFNWDKWLKFYVLYDNSSVVGFSGIRNYGKYARVFDRYFIFPEYRKQGFGDGEYCQIFVKELISNTFGRIPFFSIEHALKRSVLFNAINSCNEVLPEHLHFHALPGMYETAPNSWQNIAIQKPHLTIDLNYKP